MPTIQYSARSAQLCVNKLFTFCIRRGRVSRDSVVGGDWSACYWMMSALSDVLSTRIGRHIKFGEISCTECTGQRNNLEFIPMVEMETKNPVEGYFGSEFPTICNNCGDMAAWIRKTLKIFENFFAFLEETAHWSKIFWNTVPKVFIVKPISMLCSNFVKFGRREIAEIVHYLTKRICLALQLSLLRGSCPNSAWASPLQCGVLQILSKSVHFRHSYSQMREHCQNAM